MAKLGKYEYPEIELNASVDVARKMSSDFAGEVSRSWLARSLGMAERGGAFASRLTALRLWGITTGRSRIRLTRDGLRAASPFSHSDALSSMRDLAGSVPLFVQLGNRIGRDPCDAKRMASLLEEITGAGRQEVSRRVATIDRVFGEVRQLLAEDRSPARSDSGARAGDVQSEVDADGAVSSGPSAAAGGDIALSASEGRIEIKLPDGSLSLPETVETIDAALSVLLARRRKVAAAYGGADRQGF